MENFISPAPPPEEILSHLRSTKREKVYIEDRTFLLERPEDSEKLMDHPSVHAAFVRDEYMPYWTDLWPASRMLARAILHEPWPANTVALEIGCGLGLPGIAALSRGVNVVFSDYDASALKFAARNAKLNGFSNFKTLQLDWRRPPEGLKYSVILASDLIYEVRNLEPLIQFVQRGLTPDGFCLLSDVDRKPAQAFREALANSGLAYSMKMMRAGEPGGNRVKGTVYRLSLPNAVATAPTHSSAS